MTYNAMPKPYQVKNGAMICEGAEIGEGTIVFPGAYVDSDVKIGKTAMLHPAFESSAMCRSAMIVSFAKIR